LSSYLLSTVVVMENRNLHLLNIIQELLFIPSKSWSKPQIKANTKQRYKSPTKVHKEPRVPLHYLFRDSAFSKASCTVAMASSLLFPTSTTWTWRACSIV
jgi:hypothetical protein